MDTAPDTPDPRVREGREVARMFGAIAPTYDLLNHLLSINVDRVWRREAACALAPERGERVLDLCTGTGDLALALVRAGVRVVGADFSGPMLARAWRKAGREGVALELVRGDAQRLPFRDGAFAAASVAFGVRNFQDIPKGLAEISRVLAPGGRLAVLEFSTPRGRLFGPLYAFYFRRILPALGRLISKESGAYGYLPATVGGFPGPEPFAALLTSAGFRVESQRPMTFGIVHLHLARRDR